MIVILQWIGIIMFMVLIAKIFEYFQEKKSEHQQLKEDVHRQKIENLRLKSMITNQCPDCSKEKTDEMICSCGFTYADGNYCDSCSKYYPYSELKKGMTMLYPDDPFIYECKECEGKVFNTSG
ncbi:hypothetical protein [Peribacillus simplex]|uniref:hypothetical protein n=1 Tax=Peribacillus simplex TaxID=1478 RepID=UPI003D27767E